MSVTSPGGFRAAGVHAGLKPSGRPDVALVVNDGPDCPAAAVFTTNRCVAHPVLWSRQALCDGVARAVLLTSGGANCFTGPDGFALTHETAEAVAVQLGAGAIDVQVCATGLIGVLPDRGRTLAGVEQATASLDADGGDAAAEAILTTDSVPKQTLVEEGGYTVGGMAKGAGMLAPSLATMLVVLTTDAVADAPTCDAALRAATRETFDRLDSDGCTSTNDQVLLMSSGRSGVRPTYDALASTLRTACHDLAMQLLADAEGADHEIAVRVTGAASEDDAVEVARSVVRSNLFKAAVFGRDPNWGRILASVGTTSAAYDPLDLDVTLNGIRVCRATAAADPADRVDLSGRQVDVLVDLKAGDAAATVWTNDLTHAYVHENSAYST